MHRLLLSATVLLAALVLPSLPAQFATPQEAIQAFQDACDGPNLAEGRPVSFRPAPNYSLTVKGDSDAQDLTDGVLSASDRLWWMPEAVAFQRAWDGIFVTIDLGEVRHVRKVVVRLQGGVIDKYTVFFPENLTVWVSRDGREYYPAQALVKLKATEDYLSDWKTLYYLPENLGEGKNDHYYIYPFQLEVQADARYVCLSSVSQQHINFVSDEVAVIEASEEEVASPDYGAPYTRTPRRLQHGGVLVTPKQPVFYVAEGIYLRNLLSLENQRTEPFQNLEYAIELPEQVTYQPSEAWPAWLRTLASRETNDGRTLWRFRPERNFQEVQKVLRFGFGPFFFAVPPGTEIPPEQKYVQFISYVDGQEDQRVRMPLEILSIPRMPTPWKRLDTSLWLENRFHELPTHNQDELSLGFSTAMFFASTVEQAKEALPLIEKARAAGRRIRLEMEPTALLRKKNGGKNESRCVGSTSTCLAYRGQEYQEAVEQVRQVLQMLPVDVVVFDIEDWEPNYMNNTIRSCTRCQEEKNRRGMESWVEYFDVLQAEYVSAFTYAVQEGAQAAGRPVPRVGYYAVSPEMSYRCQEGPVPFLGYSRLYPALCDEIQNSYYGRSPAEAGQQMRRVYQATGGMPERLIPWRTAGTGAYHTQPMGAVAEEILLETLMNGAGGVQYFYALGFESPLDYFYVARAFSLLAPYEDILMDGSLEEEIQGDNPGLSYTARRLDDQLLLLVGNYGTQRMAADTLYLPEAASVTRLSPQGTVSLDQGTLSLEIPADGYVLCLLNLSEE
ncbi:MAG: hypothetical protein ACI4SG_05885 [Oligosphaeraceae bacterium]